MLCQRHTHTHTHAHTHTRPQRRFPPESLTSLAPSILPFCKVLSGACKHAGYFSPRKQKKQNNLFSVGSFPAASTFVSRLVLVGHHSARLLLKPPPAAPPPRAAILRVTGDSHLAPHRRPPGCAFFPWLPGSLPGFPFYLASHIQLLNNPHPSVLSSESTRSGSLPAPALPHPSRHHGGP